MSILNSLFIAGIISAVVVLAIDFFIDWRKETVEKKKILSLQKHPLPFPLIVGARSRKEDIAPNTDTSCCMHRRRLAPATKINEKKVITISKNGRKLFSKFKLTEDGRAAVRRGKTVFYRDLVA